MRKFYNYITKVLGLSDDLHIFENLETYLHFKCKRCGVQASVQPGNWFLGGPKMISVNGRWMECPSTCSEYGMLKVMDS